MRLVLLAALLMACEWPGHEHDHSHKPEGAESPYWLIPVVTDGTRIDGLGILDHDTRNRRMIIRLVHQSGPGGVGVAVGAQYENVEVGAQTTAVDAKYRPVDAPHFIQVWYEDIPPVNHGVLYGGFIDTARGREVYPATTGTGIGRITDDHLAVDWIE